MLRLHYQEALEKAYEAEDIVQAKGDEKLLAFRQLTAALQETKHKWVLLSYPWEGEADSKPQSHAMRVYMALVQRRLPVWMDIMGGVSGDLNLAMATAVPGTCSTKRPRWWQRSGNLPLGHLSSCMRVRARKFPGLINCTSTVYSLSELISV